MGVRGANGVSLDRDCARESAAPGDSVDGVLGVERPEPPPGSVAVTYYVSFEINISYQ